MNIVEAQEGGVLVLSPQGRLDSNTAKLFEAGLMGKIESGERRILVDFGQLDYISSAGLRVILMGAKKLKTLGGRFALSSLSENIKEVFDISGFSTILEIHPDRPTALAAMG